MLLNRQIDSLRLCPKFQKIYNIFKFIAILCIWTQLVNGVPLDNISTSGFYPLIPQQPVALTVEKQGPNLEPAHLVDPMGTAASEFDTSSDDIG